MMKTTTQTASPILMGPLLGFEEGNYYTVCALCDASVTSVGLVLNKVAAVPFEKVATTPKGAFWRAEVKIPFGQKGKRYSYELQISGKAAKDRHNRNAWEFYVPAADEKPKIAYASCNGFSDAKLAANTTPPFVMWSRMQDEHKKPFSLLLLGGDQVYADEIWETNAVPELNEWRDLFEKKRLKYKASPQLKQKLDEFYENLYIKRWSDEIISLSLASIPSVMMWDDHDIFDGWGSYSEEMQKCEVYQSIFECARKYFELFQVRSRKNRSLLESKNHYSQGFSFSKYLILSLDNRSERTLNQIMSEGQWSAVKGWLDGVTPGSFDTLLLMTAVPVVYRSFAKVEAIFALTPWMEELEDDVNDHWTAKRHQGERMKLVMNLLDFTRKQNCRSVILSGDVHVGGLGLINDTVNKKQVYQIISTGIVHPPPSVFQWLGILAATSDAPEKIGAGEIVIEMIDPVGSDRYIVSRNFATLQIGTDSKLWVNWICEQNLTPVYAIN